MLFRSLNTVLFLGATLNASVEPGRQAGPDRWAVIYVLAYYKPVPTYREETQFLLAGRYGNSFVYWPSKLKFGQPQPRPGWARVEPRILCWPTSRNLRLLPA